MIELKNLSGGYRRADVVRDISLRLRGGRITAVVGENGCGKSTLFKLVCGQLPPSGGAVLWRGRPLGGFTRTEIAQRISYLPQSRAVPDISVGALVLHGRFPWLGYPRVYRAGDKAAAEAAMRQTEIWHKRHALLASLSGGERQKAYIAMTLAQNTDCILLDEPTTHLDAAHQLACIELLHLLKDKGKAVAVVLHDINMALACADEMAVIKAGRLLAAGPPEQVLAAGALEEAFGVRVSRAEQIVFSRRL
ncbi:MAG: ABC transporter ATP-binding protein [Oscillospiraceae bacterium]|nr:ABC transporter ATP-binding protein [Oscillospiraceae bacterium]